MKEFRIPSEDIQDIFIKGKRKGTNVTVESSVLPKRRKVLKKNQRVVENIISSEDDDNINSIKYYSSSRSNKIVMGKYEIDCDKISSKTKEIILTCRQFHSLVDKSGLVNGQIIDAFAIIIIKNWKSEIMYMPTDDARTAVGDYQHTKRKTNISLYNVDSSLPDLIFIPYVFHFHWRLLIFNITNKLLTLLNPYKKATDSTRVFEEFKKFLKVFSSPSEEIPFSTTRRFSLKTFLPLGSTEDLAVTLAPFLFFSINIS